jgi:uncharacterized membrane protein (DUF441 family)
MQASNFLISLVRTWIPTGVGVVVAWLTAYGFELSQENEVAIAGGIVALVTALYYWGARALESRWPAFGYLLGVPKQPEYPEA